ncbi:hypothetical protein OC835_003226 [Tilletia horrida]|nr:hypothetical protein OC835_003226 [Tilletia horrida]
MRGFLLLSFLSLTALVSALTTGPYNIGDGSYLGSDANGGAGIRLSQGAATNVFNTTRQCSVKGSGINIASTTFRFGTIFYLPSRANASSIYISANSDITAGIPLSVIKIFADAGATSVTTSNGSSLIVAQLQDGASTVGTYLGNSHGPRAGISTPIRAGAAFTIAQVTVPGNTQDLSAGIILPVPATATSVMKFSQGYMTFILSGAGKEANVTYCTFTGIGTMPLQISLAGLKSNSLVSTSNLIKFSQGQTNINITYPVTQFLRTAYPSAAKASIKLSAFNVTVTNASPATKNLVPSTGYTSAVYALPISASTFAVPSLPSGAPASTFPAVSFTPTKLGTGATALLAQGAVRGTINLYDSASALLAAVPLRCDNTGSQAAVLPYDIA